MKTTNSGEEFSGNDHFSHSIPRVYHQTMRLSQPLVGSEFTVQLRAAQLAMSEHQNGQVYFLCNKFTQKLRDRTSSEAETVWQTFSPTRGRAKQDRTQNTNKHLPMSSIITKYSIDLMQTHPTDFYSCSILLHGVVWKAHLHAANAQIYSHESYHISCLFTFAHRSVLALKMLCECKTKIQY